MVSEWGYCVAGLILFAANIAAWAGLFYRLPGHWVITAQSALCAHFFPNTSSGLGLGWGTITMLFILASCAELAVYATRRRKELWQKYRISAETIAGAAVGGVLGAMMGLFLPLIGPLLAVIAAVGGAALGSGLSTFREAASAARQQKAPPRPVDLVREARRTAALEIAAQVAIGLTMLLLVSGASFAG